MYHRQKLVSSWFGEYRSSSTQFLLDKKTTTNIFTRNKIFRMIGAQMWVFRIHLIDATAVTKFGLVCTIEWWLKDVNLKAKQGLNLANTSFLSSADTELLKVLQNETVLDASLRCIHFHSTGLKDRFGWMGILTKRPAWSETAQKHLLVDFCKNEVGHNIARLKDVTDCRKYGLISKVGFFQSHEPKAWVAAPFFKLGVKSTLMSPV